MAERILYRDRGGLTVVERLLYRDRGRKFCDRENAVQGQRRNELWWRYVMLYRDKGRKFCGIENAVQGQRMNELW